MAYMEELKKQAIEAGYEVPEEPSGKDAREDVEEPEVITYGDGE